MTLETFLPELNKLMLLRYAAFMEKPPFQLSASQLDLEELPFQLNASQLDLYRQSNLSKQLKVLEAGLAKVEMRTPIEFLDGIKIDLKGAIFWKNFEIISIKNAINKLSGNERLAITIQTTRLAFMMQSHYEKQSSFPLLLSGEEDQAEAAALIGQDEAAALTVAAESTNQKRKADNLAQRDKVFKIAPSA
jgi:GTPase SAR1 family protein